MRSLLLNLALIVVVLLALASFLLDPKAHSQAAGAGDTAPYVSQPMTAPAGR